MPREPGRVRNSPRLRRVSRGGYTGRRSQRREFCVGNDSYSKNGLATFDFVAVGEHRILNFRAIEERAVTALAIDNATTLRAALHYKVETRHKGVVRQRKLRAPRRSAYGDGLPSRQGNDLAGHRPRLYFKEYAHSLFVQTPHAPLSMPLS
jgi:hypothetical protein